MDYEQMYNEQTAVEQISGKAGDIILGTPYWTPGVFHALIFGNKLLSMTKI